MSPYTFLIAGCGSAGRSVAQVATQDGRGQITAMISTSTSTYTSTSTSIFYLLLYRCVYLSLYLHFCLQLSFRLPVPPSLHRGSFIAHGSHSAPFSKSPLWGGLIPTLGLGRGWGLELYRFRLLKESLAPFVGSLKPTRLAFNNSMHSESCTPPL